MDTPFDNPFATRWTAPGAIDFIFSDQECLESLLERFARLGSRAVIFGPHGCGKSTLLATVRREFERLGRPAVFVSLRAGSRRIPRASLDQVLATPRGLLCIDGWEQIGPWAQWRTVWRARRKPFDLLVSAHHPSCWPWRPSLPALVRIEPDWARVREIVARLVAGRHVQVPESVVADSFDRWGGNVREILFDLYDWYERNHR